MHLMYTLDANGNRVYTLKVRSCYSKNFAHSESILAQKITANGKVTKSAHPGTVLLSSSIKYWS